MTGNNFTFKCEFMVKTYMGHLKPALVVFPYLPQSLSDNIFKYADNQHVSLDGR